MSSALYDPEARPIPSLSACSPSPAWPVPTPAAPLSHAFGALAGGGVLQVQLGARAEPGEVGGKVLVGLFLLSGAGLLRPGCDRI